MIKKLGIYLEYEMNKKGIRSAGELAKRCNNKISPDFINKIKRGTPQTVTIETLKILASGLDVTLKELLTHSEIIEDTDEYGLSLEAVDSILANLSDTLNDYKIDINKLNKFERFELANRLYDYIEMISHFYRNDK